MRIVLSLALLWCVVDNAVAMEDRELGRIQRSAGAAITDLTKIVNIESKEEILKKLKEYTAKTDKLLHRLSGRDSNNEAVNSTISDIRGQVDIVKRLIGYKNEDNGIQKLEKEIQNSSMIRYNVGVAQLAEAIYTALCS